MSTRQPASSGGLKPAVAVVVVLLMTTMAPISTAQGVGEEPPIGEMIWPPSGRTNPDDFVDLGAQVLNENDALVRGRTPTASFDIERLNETFSRITIQEEGGPTYTFLQEHLPPQVSKTTYGEEIVLLVRPAQLQSVISLAPGTGGLGLRAAPSAFNISGDTPLERFEDLLTKLELPQRGSPSMSVDTYIQRRGRTEGLTPRIYGQPGPTCIQEADGGCTRDATVELACSDCTASYYRVYPHPGDELTALTDGEISVKLLSSNLMTVIVDSQGALVSVSVAPAIDLDPAAVLPPDEARSRAVQYVEDRGYRLNRFEPTNRSGLPDSVRLDFHREPSSILPQRATYQWTIPVVNASDTKSNFHLTQDARSGAVLNASQTGVGPVGHHPVRPSNPIPAWGVWAVAVGALLAAAGVRIRGRSR